MTEYELSNSKFASYDPKYCFSGYPLIGRETLTLSEEEQNRLKILISRMLKMQRNINGSVDSYILKLIFGKLLGKYVSNADIKKAMTELGYHHDKRDPIDWCFNVRSKNKYIHELYAFADDYSRLLRDSKHPMDEKAYERFVLMYVKLMSISLTSLIQKGTKNEEN